MVIQSQCHVLLLMKRVFYLCVANPHDTTLIIIMQGYGYLKKYDTVNKQSTFASRRSFILTCPGAAPATSLWGNSVILIVAATSGYYLLLQMHEITPFFASKNPTIVRPSIIRSHCNRPNIQSTILIQPRCKGAHFVNSSWWSCS